MFIVHINQSLSSEQPALRLWNSTLPELQKPHEPLSSPLSPQNTAIIFISNSAD